MTTFEQKLHQTRSFLCNLFALHCAEASIEVARGRRVKIPEFVSSGLLLMRSILIGEKSRDALLGPIEYLLNIRIAEDAPWELITATDPFLYAMLSIRGSSSSPYDAALYAKLYSYDREHGRPTIEEHQDLQQADLEYFRFLGDLHLEAL